MTNARVAEFSIRNWRKRPNPVNMAANWIAIWIIPFAPLSRSGGNLVEALHPSRDYKRWEGGGVLGAEHRVNISNKGGNEIVIASKGLKDLPEPRRDRRIVSTSDVYTGTKRWKKVFPTKLILDCVVS